MLLMRLIYLSATNKKASKFLLKMLDSAVANINYIDDNSNFDPSDLYVKTIFVDGGPMLKRFRPAAMGRATPIRKRMSHITITIRINKRYNGTEDKSNWY